MARYIVGSLTVCAALLAAGCARATETPHVCNDADIKHWVARGKLPAKDYTFRVSLDGAGVKFSGTEYPLEIKATYFDSKGSCTISPDKLIVTWSPWQAGGEMPMTWNGAKAVFRANTASAHPNDPAWADVISNADDLIAGVQLADHRFDALPLHSGPAFR